MNKVICDICGTAYPETSSQCPICGCAREVGTGSTTAPNVKRSVKGGRFSKSNVRKRNKAAAAASAASMPKPARTAKPKPKQVNPSRGASNGLVATAVILLIAIILVVAYILVRFVLPIPLWDKTDTTTMPGTPAPSTAATGAAPAAVACTELNVDADKIELDAVGRAWLLTVKLVPGDTTDVLTFVSSNEKVATVSNQGRVTAVGEGQAVITVSCGNITKQIPVSVALPEETKAQETTKPVEETTETTADVTLTLDRDSITFTETDETYAFEIGGPDAAEIIWSSDDVEIAVVENGVVTAVAPGTTTIYAQYGNQQVSCTVTCDFEIYDDGGSYTISHEDVTISVDETFTLKLRDFYTNSVDVNWSSSDNDVCTVDGNTVTGVGSGTATVSTTYRGNTYSCIVRVG